MNRKVYRSLVFMYEIHASVVCVWVLGDYDSRIKYSGYTVNEAVKKHYEKVKGLY